MRYFSPFLLQLLVWLPTRIMLKYFGHLKIEGTENLKGLKGGVIFALNHSSELDVVLLPVSLNPFSRFMPIFYVSRERKYYKKSGWKSYFYGGAWFKMWGAYRARVGKKNYDVALERHIELLKLGKNLCVFPEGRKTETGKLGPAHGGIIHLANKTGAVIVPVALSGHYKMTGKEFFARKRTIAVSFLKPISVEELELHPDITYTQYKVIADQRIMRAIASSLDSE